MIANRLTHVAFHFFFICSLTLKYVDRGIEALQRKESSDTKREASVLEKLLKIDRHVAVVMTMDMIFAGVDTVSMSGLSTSESLHQLKLLSVTDFIGHGCLPLPLGQKSRQTGAAAPRDSHHSPELGQQIEPG